jgi:hypothetical protein
MSEIRLSYDESCVPMDTGSASANGRIFEGFITKEGTWRNSVGQQEQITLTKEILEELTERYNEELVSNYHQNKELESSKGVKGFISKIFSRQNIAFSDPIELENGVPIYADHVASSNNTKGCLLGLLKVDFDNRFQNFGIKGKMLITDPVEINDLLLGVKKTFSIGIKLGNNKKISQGKIDEVSIVNRGAAKGSDVIKFSEQSSHDIQLKSELVDKLTNLKTNIVNLEHKKENIEKNILIDCFAKSMIKLGVFDSVYFNDIKSKASNLSSLNDVMILQDIMKLKQPALKLHSSTNIFNSIYENNQRNNMSNQKKDLSSPVDLMFSDSEETNVLLAKDNPVHAVKFQQIKSLLDSNDLVGAKQFCDELIKLSADAKTASFDEKAKQESEQEAKKIDQEIKEQVKLKEIIEKEFLKLNSTLEKSLNENKISLAESSKSSEDLLAQYKQKLAEVADLENRLFKKESK